ncbi:MAG: aldose epimerase family protein [Boseongicola sp.]
MERFGTMPDGTPIYRIRLQSGQMEAWFLNYGAVLQDLRLGDHPHPLVLGFPAFLPYLTHSPYFGAIAGRCANRIRDGHLELERKTYQLDRNFLGKHTLHGGTLGTGKNVWNIEKATADSVAFAIDLADGEMGFPGSLDAKVVYSLGPHATLDIRMEATTDAPTLCNLAHHSYFTLDGTGSIANHLLQIDADNYLPVDEELIPTSEIRAVADTRFDFRSPRPVANGGSLDHNFCLSSDRQVIRKVARLASVNSGVSMEVRTTEPGLQIYDGSRIDIEVPGLAERPMSCHAGIAIEPQIWPDANHNQGFPSVVLRPGQTYHQHTQFAFSKETP